MTVAVEIHRAGGDEALHLVSGELVYVYADTAAKRSLPLPEEWRQRMIALEKTPVLT
jgi:acyl-CoA thioester hydrolase